MMVEWLVKQMCCVTLKKNKSNSIKPQDRSHHPSVVCETIRDQSSANHSADKVGYSSVYWANGNNSVSVLEDFTVEVH